MRKPWIVLFCMAGCVGRTDSSQLHFECPPKPTDPTANRIGSGTRTAPHMLCWPEQFLSLGEHPEHWGRHYRLAEDVDLTSVQTELTPIGTDTEPFEGTFDGGGFVISGIQIDGSGLSNVGLFRRVRGEGEVIFDLGLRDADVRGGSWVGALVGYLEQGIVARVWATGATRGSGNHTGGLIGHTDAGTVVRDSYSAVTVTNTNGASHGVLIGHNEAAVERCYAVGQIEAASDRVGGLVGWSTNGGTITDSFASVSVRGTTASSPNTSIGPLVGTGSSTNSYYDVQQPCSTAAGCNTNGLAADTTDLPGYFFDPQQPPMDVWDFDEVWERVLGTYPQLRLPE